MAHFNDIDDELHRKFRHASVVVCGLGGLGSNIAIHLVRAGIGRLTLIDFDRVDASNLDRQQYNAAQVGQLKTHAMLENLREISPSADIVTKCVRMDESNYSELLADADIICEAFDDAAEKSRLVNYILEKLPEKTVVAASGMAGLGSPNDIITRRITEHFYICGDGSSSVEKGEKLYAPRAALCAAHQALTVLRIIANSNER